MKNLLKKELKLTASPLSFCFIAFGLMALIPNYPILVGAFFVSFGIFHTFQSARENSDILYSALLPVKKSDVVKSKFIFCVFIELCGFAVMLIASLVRMTLLKDAVPYANGALMNANFVFLGFALAVFAAFNLIFVRGFFKTGYYFAKPFILFIVVAFLIIGVAETLHHIPYFAALNSAGFENLPLQLIILLCGAIIYILITLLSLKLSEKSFSKIDL